MNFDQIAALVVLIGVVGVLIHGRIRSDVAALSAAAALLLLGVIRPVEVQGAFASPACRDGATAAVGSRRLD